MSTTRKLLAMVLALIMIMSLATTAFATDITITGGASDSQYSAYKLLDANDLGDNKFAFTLNAKYTDVLKAVTQKETEAEILDYISAIEDRSEAAQKFADAVYAEILEEKLDADITTTNGAFSNVAQGYYLIAETKVGASPDSYSLVMLDTAGKESIEVETKEDVPESEKKVKDTNDSVANSTTDWQDSADHDINDEVPFQITFTLPSDFANYESYYVGIHDVQAKGLTYNNDLKVTVNGATITDWFTYSNATGGDGCTFHISCADIIAQASEDKVTLKGGDKIVFEYTSILNGDAVLGSTGNPNEMQVEFSNNPYGDGTSKTPKDKVIVFTYKVNVDKYSEKVEEGNRLNGANFTLYKEVPADTEGAQTGKAIKAAFTADNIKADALDDNKSYIVVGNKSGDATGSTFGFAGVDDGNYVLVETTVPAGYNAWDAVAFTITATHNTTSDDPKLTNLTGGDKFTGEVSTGVLDTNVINNAGTELPSTGGMGTTMFYVIGGILVLAAVVLLVTKRRMTIAE